jgi:hypothetical protein
MNMNKAGVAATAKLQLIAAETCVENVVSQTPVLLTQC